MPNSGKQQPWIARRRCWSHSHRRRTKVETEGPLGKRRLEREFSRKPQTGAELGKRRLSYAHICATEVSTRGALQSCAQPTRATCWRCVWSQSHALETISSSERFAFQLRIRRALEGSATNSAGSPARRAASFFGTSSPVIRSMAEMTSFTEFPRPVARLNASDGP